MFNTIKRNIGHNSKSFNDKQSISLFMNEIGKIVNTISIDDKESCYKSMTILQECKSTIDELVDSLPRKVKPNSLTEMSLGIQELYKSCKRVIDN